MISALGLPETCFGSLETRKDIGHLMVIAGHEVWPPVTEKPRPENLKDGACAPNFQTPRWFLLWSFQRLVFWVIGDQEGHWSSDGHCRS